MPEAPKPKLSLKKRPSMPAPSSDSPSAETLPELSPEVSPPPSSPFSDLLLTPELLRRLSLDDEAKKVFQLIQGQLPPEEVSALMVQLTSRSSPSFSGSPSTESSRLSLMQEESSPSSPPLPYLLHVASDSERMTRTEVGTLAELIELLQAFVTRPDLTTLQLSICRGLPLRLTPLPLAQLIDEQGEAHLIADQRGDVAVPADNDSLSPAAPQRRIGRTQEELLHWLRGEEAAAAEPAEEADEDLEEDLAAEDITESLPHLDGAATGDPTGELEVDEEGYAENDEDDGFGDEPQE